MDFFADDGVSRSLFRSVSCNSAEFCGGERTKKPGYFVSSGHGLVIDQAEGMREWSWQTHAVCQLAASCCYIKALDQQIQVARRRMQMRQVAADVRLPSCGLSPKVRRRLKEPTSGEYAMSSAST